MGRYDNDWELGCIIIALEMYKGALAQQQDPKLDEILGQCIRLVSRIRTFLGSNVKKWNFSGNGDIQLIIDCLEEYQQSNEYLIANSDDKGLVTVAAAENIHIPIAIEKLKGMLS